MGKPGGGGGGGTGSTIFTSQLLGPPPGNATTGSEQWIDMGLIPIGFKMWFGTGQYTSPEKSITFELRTNKATKSLGNLNDTTLLASCSVSPRSGTLTVDYYKGGTLNISTVVGTGTEKWWLRLVSKTSTAGSYLYSIKYTTV